MLYSVYRFLTSASSPVLNRLLDKRLQRGKEDGVRLPERKGEATIARPKGKVMWLHGASVGESLSALPLLNTLMARLPDWSFMITTGTVTSADLMKKRLPKNVIHQFIPLDHPQWCRHFVDHWQPDAVIWLESELWPNMLYEIQRRAIPAALLNARMRPASYRKWRYARSLIEKMLSGFTFILVGARDYLPLFRKLGGKNVHYVGSLKFGAAALPLNETEYDAFDRLTQNRLRIGFMSTHPTEEILAASVHVELKKQFPDLLTVIVPRHASRGSEIAREIKAEMPLAVALRSAGDAISSDTDVYIADTMGEMGMWYKACPLVVMGGSFIPFGGQNPLEATHFGAAVLYGPSMFNFTELCLAMEQAGAAEPVMLREKLASVMADILNNPANLASRQEASRQLAEQNLSVLDAYADEIIIQLVGQDA